MESKGAEAASVIARRNKAIASSLCKRMSVDPKTLSSESIEGYSISSLFSNILSLSEGPLKNQDEVIKWVQFANNFPSEYDARLITLKGLNEDLNQKAVLLGAGLKRSEADIVVFCALHPFVTHLYDTDKQNFPDLMRWMDYIQNNEEFSGALETIAVKKTEFGHFCFRAADNAGLSTRKDSQDMKDANKSEVNMNPQKVVAETPGDDKASAESRKDNKATKEKKKPLEKESAEKEAEVSVTILNMQVAVIRKAWKHPSADSLLVEEIDVGDGKLRQVVSGLAKYCSPDELSNRRVVLITNVKPGKLRDVMSAGLDMFFIGMPILTYAVTKDVAQVALSLSHICVLCASNQDQTVVEPLIPPEGALLGERVTFTGYEGKPEDVLNPKKKELEKITPNLYTDDSAIATYKGIPFMTSAGPCTSSLFKAAIK